MVLRRRSRAKPFIMILVSVVCLALLAFGVLLVLDYLEVLPAGGGSADLYRIEGLDPAAVTGALPGSPRNEKSPGDGVFGYRINTAPKFDEDGAGGDILVENPQFNQYLLVLEIAEDGKLVYTSQYIAPNQYIKTIDLETTPAAGEHQATAYLNAVDPETLALVGTLECPINYTVS